MRISAMGRPTQLFAIVALFASAFGALLIAQPARAQSGLPDWETPPMYYRPSSTNFLAGDNDPINVIMYGPGLTSTVIQAALDTLGSTSSTLGGTYSWLDNTGQFTALGVTKNCTNDVVWSPVDAATARAQTGGSATTPCPAIDPDAIIQGALFYRNHNRYWQFSGGDYTTYGFPNPGAASVYAAVSYEEPFVRILPNTNPLYNIYAPYPAGAGGLDCGIAHCLANYNDGRDDFARDALAGGNLRGWGTAIKSAASGPTWTNQQAGPYKQQFSSDGTVKVLCLDPANTTIQSSLPQYNGQSFCAVTPAARPISLSNLTPLQGTILPIAATQTFKVDVGYSDELRSIASVSFSFNYTRSNGSTGTVSASASAPGTSRNVGTWTGNLSIPADVQLSGSAQTQEVNLSVTVCDSAGACWKRNNLTYILADVRYDFVFLMDTTGSMGSSINLAKAQASAIAAGLSSYFPGSQFGVAEFRDFPQSPYGDPGDFPFLMRTNLTSNVTVAIAAAQALSTAGGGNDGPEAHLQALYQASQQFSFRPNSRRIAVLITDVPGHDSDTEPGYPGVGFSAAVSALNAARVKVIGVSAGGNADSFLNQVALATGTRRSNGVGAVFPITTPTLQAPALLLDIIQSSY